MIDLPFNKNIHKIILSAPTKNAQYTRAVILANNNKFQASLHTKTQVFHKNLQGNDVIDFVVSLLGTDFTQYTAWDGEQEFSARVTKKGKLLTNSKPQITQKYTSFVDNTFNKQKNHIITEGDYIPALVDLGVFTKENKVAAGMYDKFQQINRFVELVDDEAKKIPKNTVVNIIDFGCGKSYLTFLLYYYFVEKRGICANICGMDLNESVIDNCTSAAEKYGYSSITFLSGDIGKLDAPPLSQWETTGAYNIVISLHACDTATDHAIYNAVKWDADLILAAPCCQHELRNQMRPRTFNIFAEYGIIEERFASLATDAIRAKLLEYVGYRTQIIEFTTPEFTAKNLLIRARRDTIKTSPNPNILAQIQSLLDEFEFRPTLVELLIGVT